VQRGHVGKRGKAFEQIVIAGRQSAHTYYATRATERHFGLGARGTVDVAVEFYPSRKVVKRSAVPANGLVEIGEESQKKSAP